MNQGATFAILGAGGLLLTKAVTGSAWGDILSGHPGQVSTTGATLASGGVAGAGQAIATGAAGASGQLSGKPAKGSLTISQIEQQWVAAGGNPAKASIAAAVAMAESSGRIGAQGDVGLGGSGATSFGLWQIHTPAHPQYNATQLSTDPLYNARAAVAISNNGTDWTPWSTYTSGAYQRYLSAAESVVYTALLPLGKSIASLALAGAGG